MQLVRAVLLALVFAWPGIATNAVEKAGRPPAPPILEVSFDQVLPAMQGATAALRPARDAALARFAMAEEPPLAETKLAGARRLPLPGPGSYRIELASPDFLPIEAVLDGVVESRKLPALTLRRANLVPALRLVADGAPLAGAEVLARPTAELFPAPWRPGVLRSRSDAAGVVRLPAGIALEVVVLAAGRAPWQDLAEPRTGALREVALAAGREILLELRGPAGQPVAGAAVAVGNVLLAERTSAEGRLAISLAPGRETVLRVLGAAGAWASRQLDGALPEDGRLPIVLEPALRLPFRVLDGTTGRPLAGALLWPGGHPEILARSSPEGVGELAIPWGGTATLAAAAPAYLPLVADSASASRLLLQPAPPPGLAVQGRIEDREARPVAGAEVLLRASAEQSSSEPADPERGLRAKTDARGVFTFAAVEPSEVDLWVRAAGFAPAAVRGIAVAPGRDREPALLGTVVLEPGAVVAGRVVDTGGEPLAEARVLAREADAVAPAGLPLREVRTPADGSFRFTDFAPGTEIELWAEHEKARSLSRRVRVGEEAETLLALEAAARVAGRVVAEGHGVAGALVLLRSSGQTVASGKSGEDGDFELQGAPAGLFEIEAIAAGLVGEPLAVEVTAGEPVADLELELSPGGVVAGRVRSARGEPLEGVEVALAVEDLGLRWQLTAPSTRSADDGTYRLSGLPSGRLTLRARRADLPPAEQQLELGAEGRELDWQLEAGGELAGRILTSAGKPVAGARITAFDAAGRSVGEPLRSDDQGRFRLVGLPSGPLRVRGEPDQEALVEREVAPGATEEILLVCPPAGQIAGRLLGASFDALARAEVWANGPGGAFRRGQVDYDGLYRIVALGEGEWRVGARAPGFPREANGAVALGPGERGTLDLEFSAAGYRLAGVVRSRGRPLAGLAVAAAAASGAAGGARTGADGSFAIEALPAGSYQLIFVGGGAPLGTRQVELRGNVELAFDLDPAPGSPAGDAGASPK